MLRRGLLSTFSRPNINYLHNNSLLGTSISSMKRNAPFSTTQVVRKDEKIKVKFNLHSGKTIVADANVGDTLLDVVVNNELEIEGFGACEGTLTCSTCHVILKPEDYDRLPEGACDEETDMLDLAYGLTDTSRLGCQITLTKDMDGLEVKVPETINDARS